MAVLAGDVMYHIRCKARDVGRYVLLPGDPGRVEPIAALFDEHWHVASHREYTTYTGRLEGELVSVTSTGIGCPSTAIAVEELEAIGADTFIRVGTSGAMQLDIDPGDLVIGSGAIRDEGTSRQYLPLEFPAVASLDVILALSEAANKLGQRHHIGIVHSKDSFYGEVEPQRMPLRRELEGRWAAWVAGGALASEMEAAALFTICSYLRKRAGCLLLAAANLERARQQNVFDVLEELDDLLAVAVEGLRILIRHDRLRAQYPDVTTRAQRIV